VRLEAGIENRLIHRDVIPGGAAAVEAHGAAVEHGARVEIGGAVDATAEAEPGVVCSRRDAGLRLAKTGDHFLRGVADRRNDSHAGDDDAIHPFRSVSVGRH
jgi:hypothetical protein